ncbi:DUF3991 and TOPRIM domain-containing protein [uncultured Rhodoblastus sp.]|uniref:DUF3991 and TOPRIM domain-containing protein n=1 Tax=uncultured Rhodoblastus sp. TaxID=543037 RepID=UPI0025E47FFE|nr:DUF3991 and TOPRIM domain-containing protein [uncultured Rhodoblastus sp.]
MKDPESEVEELRAGVSCATVLENSAPPWRLDRAESSQRCLKYRRSAGEIVIVTHEGAGWWDPNSDAKGDVFGLVQHLEPRLNFGEVRKLLRPLAGVEPDFTPAIPTRDKSRALVPIAERWARRPRLRQRSNTWRYLRGRRLPEDVLFEAARCDVVREGPHGSAWFAHRDCAGAVIHVDVRGPTYTGSLTGGSKSLFVFPFDKKRRRYRFVLAEAPIDALSLAAFEYPREDTIYAATAGGMGPTTIEAIKAHLLSIKNLPNAQFDSATDANAAGDRYAARHEEFAQNIGVPFRRLRPAIEGQDWNDVLQSRRQIQ